jgi:trk system potassium uptake protein TrkA
VFACTDNDNVNILISQISIRLHSVKRVLARVYDKGRQELCTQLGVRTICPSEVLGGMFLEALNKEA